MAPATPHHSVLFQGIDLVKLEFSCFPTSSVDNDLAPGNYFAVPLETYSMESVICPAAPRKYFEKLPAHLSAV